LYGARSVLPEIFLARPNRKAVFFIKQPFDRVDQPALFAWYWFDYTQGIRYFD
jgi:hypothetical protein